MEYEVEYANIRAEVLLNYLYPESEDKWVVENKGLFYRNYQEDLISLDVAKCQVSLARSSYLKLLPAGMISDERSVGKDIASRERVRRSIRQLEEVFKPVDSYRFRRNVGNESHLAALYEQRVESLLKLIYGFDLSSVENSYLRRVAPMLLLRDRIKGDMGLIRDLLTTLLDREVSMEIDSYQHNDWSEIILTRVRYTVVVEGLSADRYRIQSEELQPLFEFIREWFVPLEIVAQFIIHDSDLDSKVKSRGLLGYNLKLGEKSSK